MHSVSLKYFSETLKTAKYVFYVHNLLLYYFFTSHWIPANQNVKYNFRETSVTKMLNIRITVYISIGNMFFVQNKRINVYLLL